MPAQGELFCEWRHSPFATNRTEPIAVVEAELLVVLRVLPRGRAYRD